MAKHEDVTVDKEVEVKIPIFECDRCGKQAEADFDGFYVNDDGEIVANYPTLPKFWFSVQITGYGIPNPGRFLLCDNHDPSDFHPCET